MKIPEVKPKLEDIAIIEKGLEKCSIHIDSSIIEDQVSFKEKRHYTKQKSIENLCKLRYKYQGSGITFLDLITVLNYTRGKSQRTLKHFHEAKVLFTARDLKRANNSSWLKRY